MGLQDWADGVLGKTPLTAARLNERDALIAAALVQLAADPSLLFTGNVSTDENGAPTSAAVTWPDGDAGIYAGTPAPAWPGAVDAYTLTKIGDATTTTYTQPAVTRDASGNITNRPAITAS